MHHFAYLVSRLVLRPRTSWWHWHLPAFPVVGSGPRAPLKLGPAAGRFAPFDSIACRIAVHAGPAHVHQPEGPVPGQRVCWS